MKINKIRTNSKERANKACTRRWDSGAIPNLCLRLSIFPVGRRSAARPSAGNANRWAVQIEKASSCQKSKKFPAR